jgi:hypothetical protein
MKSIFTLVSLMFLNSVYAGVGVIGGGGVLSAQPNDPNSFMKVESVNPFGVTFKVYDTDRSETYTYSQSDKDMNQTHLYYLDKFTSEQQNIEESNDFALKTYGMDEDRIRFIRSNEDTTFSISFKGTNDNLTEEEEAATSYFIEKSSIAFDLTFDKSKKHQSTDDSNGALDSYGNYGYPQYTAPRTTNLMPYKGSDEPITLNF